MRGWGLRTKQKSKPVGTNCTRATPETVSETMTKRGHCRFTLDPHPESPVNWETSPSASAHHSAVGIAPAPITGLKVWLTNVQWKVETHLNVQCSLFQTSVN